MTLRSLVVLFVLALCPGLMAAQPHEVTFVSDGIDLRAVLLETSSPASRALAIYLTGNPGSPIDQPSTVVDALVAAGVDVFRFNYRGQWGNGGDFTLTNAIGDLGAALDYITASTTVERLGHDPSTILLVGYSFGTAAALVGGSVDDRVDAIVNLAPCDHGYFGREFTDPNSEIRDFLDRVTESLFGEDGPIEGGGPVFINDLVENSESFGFVPQAAGLHDKKLLFLGGLDDSVCYVEDHLFPLYRRLRVLDHPALDAHVLNMDHGFQGIGIDSLMQITTQWIAASLPTPTVSGGAEHD